ncbi:MAG: hypothetical protein H7Y38_07645, partial [Armatimonadetes bacterium]|nr:hypothetical protein [Armatimonadota bacterium]
MIHAVRWTGAVCALLSLSPVLAAETEPTRLPVREVTIFKDGYAFVSREGKLPVGANGVAVLDELPIPVLGTFWTYSADKGITVRAVTAGRVETKTARDAASIAELITANIGAKVSIHETGGANAYPATIFDVRGNTILLSVPEGLHPVPFDRVFEVTILSPNPKLTLPETQTRPQLRLSLGGAKPGGTATLGVTYLQSGLRWIPGYKIVLSPATNTAKVSLQATLVNDLADMENVAANLVVGAPKWDFKNTTDPIVLQETLTLVSSVSSVREVNAYRYSNAIQTQVGSGALYDTNADAAYTQNKASDAPQVTGSESKEDFFVFSVKNVTMKRGERMVIPVAEFSLA